jgi:hypothetical protein
MYNLHYNKTWNPMSSYPADDAIRLVVEAYGEPTTAKRTRDNKFVAIVDNTVWLDNNEHDGMIKLDPIAWMDIPKHPTQATVLKTGFTILRYETQKDIFRLEIHSPDIKSPYSEFNNLSLSEMHDIEDSYSRR